jgi:hypothetical protein
MKKERDYDRSKNPVIMGAVIQEKPKTTELVNLFLLSRQLRLFLGH